MSYTAESNGSYSWAGLGTTAIQLEDYERKDDDGALLSDSLYGHMYPDIVISDGAYYNNSGTKTERSGSQFIDGFYKIPVGATKVLYSGASFGLSLIHI